MNRYIIVSVILIILVLLLLRSRENYQCDTQVEKDRCCKIVGSWYCDGKSSDNPGKCIFKQDDLNGFFSEEECIRQAFCGCPGNCSGLGQCVINGISGKVNCLCDSTHAGDSCQYSCVPQTCQIDQSNPECGIANSVCRTDGSQGLSSPDAFNSCLAEGKIPTPSQDNKDSFGWCGRAGMCETLTKTPTVVDKQTTTVLGGQALNTIWYGSRFPDSYYDCQAAGCLLGHVPILMHNDTVKAARDVVPGDLVISGISGSPTRVIANVVSRLDGQKVIGFNSLGPLATIDHNFIRHDGIRMAVNPTISFLNRYWKEIASMEVGDEFLGELPVASIQMYDYDEADDEITFVYDIITEDHSYIANGFPSYDDFPDIEENPLLALMIFKFLKAYNNLSITDISNEELSRLVMDLYERSRDRIPGWIDETKSENLKAKFREFLETYSANNFYLKLASRMWRHYYYKFE